MDAEEMTLEDEMTLEEYAALWGCDPCYDHAPRLPGDGYLFYNFAVEGENAEFLGRFLPAVERLLTKKDLEQKDKERLWELKAEVRRRLGK